MEQMLTVLSVAYPLAPVRHDTAGGAEQVLRLLDRALVRAGHRSIVLAAEGSEIEGLLVSAGKTDGLFDEQAIAAAHARHRECLHSILKRYSVDLIHMHGHDFAAYLPPPGVPVLVTLHTPRGMYPVEPLTVHRPGTYFHCVSNSQRKSWPEQAPFLPVIPNGVPAVTLPPAPRGNYAIVLGRICPEKNYHVALKAARRAGFECLLAGNVFPYPIHQQYFESEIVPLLDESRRFIGPIGAALRTKLLLSARCLLVPSTVKETSSLVSMEALSCGAPVIAFPSGALAEIVEHGKIGFLVHDEIEMADAIRRAHEIDSQVCRQTAAQRFSFDRTAEKYLQLYEKLAVVNVGAEESCAS
jgi:glycosyltransferase involved in cell wall biosynthesis